MYARFHLLLRKKFCSYAFYLTGTAFLILFSYKTANRLDPVSTPVPSLPLNTQIKRIFASNITSQITHHYYEDTDKCKILTNRSWNRKFIKSLQGKSVINYLGFVLRSHSLFYCAVPKVATRSLLPFVTYLHIRDDLLPLLTNQSTSVILNQDRDRYFKNNVHIFDADLTKQIVFPSSQEKNEAPIDNVTFILESFLSRLMIPKSSNMSKIDIWTMFQKKSFPLMRPEKMTTPLTILSENFTRVIFVRHPLERLASAYVDKIASLRAEPFSTYDNLRRAICRRYASHYLTEAERKFYAKRQKIMRPTDEPCHPVAPTFEHFIEYILSDTFSEDVHWQSYAKLCNACMFKYNYVAKYENMVKELYRFVSLLGLNSTEWNIDNYFKSGKTEQHYHSMYSNMSTTMICDLKYYYQEDFRLFDYRLEDYLPNKKSIHCPVRFKVGSKRKHR